MQFIPDFSDDRLKDYCIYCGALLANQEVSKEHVPSKVFLDKPYPENLFVIWVCSICNNSFSSDEEYVAAVLGIMMSGSPDTEKQIWERAGRILSRQTKLREQLRKNCKFDADGRFYGLRFNAERLKNVLVKNAKALALYMMSEPLYDAPSCITWQFKSQISKIDRQQFEYIESPTSYPEVGSRHMIELATSGEPIDCWKKIQKDSFRFALMWGGRITVRVVFREFLFAEIVWEDT